MLSGSAKIVKYDRKKTRLVQTQFSFKRYIPFVRHRPTNTTLHGYTNTHTLTYS